jgi:parallel beta-helix repeat protein
VEDRPGRASTKVQLITLFWAILGIPSFAGSGTPFGLAVCPAHGESDESNPRPCEGENDQGHLAISLLRRLLVCIVGSRRIAADSRHDSDCANFPDGLGSRVTSGTTITLDTDLTIDSDGDDCILISNVDRVKLMLNGHSINLGGIGLAGIRVENSRSVEIIGPGKINGFAWGVRVSGSSEVLVSRVISHGRGTGEGIALVNSSNSRLERNILFEHLQGIEVVAPFLSSPSAKNVVSQNEVFANDYGMTVFGFSNMVSRNNVSGNNAIGIRVAGGENGLNTVINNIVLGNGAWDIKRLSGQQVGDVIENNVCEVSDPLGLCPVLVPKFDIDHF